MPDELTARLADGAFKTTHWSVVLFAAENSSEGAHALETLCRGYWYPVYVFARRRGCSPPEAEDVTQGFFAQLLANGSLAGVHPQQGKFRSFLLGSMKLYLANHWRDANRLKRGGGHEILSWDQLRPEERYQLELVDGKSPEEAFDQRWAANLVARCLNRLREELTAEGGEGRYEKLKSYLQHRQTPPLYGDCATSLGLSEAAVKSAVFRLRRRYAEIVREEISQTVAAPGDIEEEMRHLITMLAR